MSLTPQATRSSARGATPTRPRSTRRRPSSTLPTACSSPTARARSQRLRPTTARWPMPIVASGSGQSGPRRVCLYKIWFYF